MIFELARDLRDAVEAMPREHPRKRMLEHLDEAVRHDIHFIDRHPATLFQCVWNTSRWYDVAKRPGHHAVASGACELLESWRREKSESAGEIPWLWALVPPAEQATVRQEVEEGVTHLAMSVDGTIMYVCMRCQIAAYRIQDWKVLWTRRPGVGLFWTVLSISSDGEFLVCALEDSSLKQTGSVMLVRASDGAEMTCADVGFRVLDTSFGDQSSLWSACGFDLDVGGQVLVGDIKGQVLWCATLPSVALRKVVIDESRAYVIGADGKGNCWFWGLRDGVVRKRVKVESSGLNDIAVSHGAGLMIAATRNGFCWLWNLDAESSLPLWLSRIRSRLFGGRPFTRTRLPFLFAAHRAGVSAVAFTDQSAMENPTCASGDVEGNLLTWTAGEENAPRLLRRGRGPVSCVASARNGLSVAAAFPKESSVWLFDLRNRRPGETGDTEGYRALYCLQKCGRFLALGARGDVSVVETRHSPDESERMTPLCAAVDVLRTSANRRYAVMIQRGSSWRTWDALESQQVATGTLANPVLTSSLLGVSDDGRFIAHMVGQELEIVDTESKRSAQYRLGMAARALRFHGARVHMAGINLRIPNTPSGIVIVEVEAPMGEVRVRHVALLAANASLDAYFSQERLACSVGDSVRARIALFDGENYDREVVVDAPRDHRLVCVSDCGRWLVFEDARLSRCVVGTMKDGALRLQWFFPTQSRLLSADVSVGGDVLCLLFKDGRYTILRMERGVGENIQCLAT